MKSKTSINFHLSPDTYLPMTSQVVYVKNIRSLFTKRPLSYLKVHHLLMFEENLCRSAPFKGRIFIRVWFCKANVLDLRYRPFGVVGVLTVTFFIFLFSTDPSKGIYWNGSLDCQTFERFFVLFGIIANHSFSDLFFMESYC